MQNNNFNIQKPIIDIEVSNCITIGYFNLSSSLFLVLIVLINTYISFKEFSLASQLLIVMPLILFWVLINGIKLKNLIYASVALIPATQIFGIGYFNFPGMSLTLTDIFTVLAICKYITQPIPLKINNFVYLTWILFIICIFSILYAENPLNHFGQLIRLSINFTLISIVISVKNNYLKKSFFYGFLLWPFVSLASVVAVAEFWRFISFNDGNVLTLNGTNEPILGSHSIVINLIFLIPLIYLYKINSILKCLILFWLSLLVIFSYSRSLIIAVTLSLLLYLFFFNFKKKKLESIFMAFFLIAALTCGVSMLGFFNFNQYESYKAESSYVRILKMLAVYKTFHEHPILGIGYGAVGAIDSSKNIQPVGATDPNFIEAMTDVKASAEFTPLQILAETGILGGLVCLALLLLSMWKLIIYLKKQEEPLYIKMTLLCSSVAFTTVFLGGNSFANLIFWLSIPQIFASTEWKLVEFKN